jgi:hypothetical protein
MLMYDRYLTPFPDPSPAASSSLIPNSPNVPVSVSSETSQGSCLPREDRDLSHPGKMVARHGPSDLSCESQRKMWFILVATVDKLGREKARPRLDSQDRASTGNGGSRRQTSGLTAEARVARRKSGAAQMHRVNQQEQRARHAEIFGACSRIRDLASLCDVGEGASPRLSPRLPGRTSDSPMCR